MFFFLVVSVVAVAESEPVTGVTESMTGIAVSGKSVSSVNWSGSNSDFSDWGDWVDGVSDLLNYGVESVDIISGVVDNADGTVGFSNTVRSLNDITITVLSLGLDIASYSISYTVVVRVTWVGLKATKILII